VKVCISCRRDTDITEEWENIVVERKSSYGMSTINHGSDKQQGGKSNEKQGFELIE
jgi:hypothetical protein